MNTTNITSQRRLLRTLASAVALGTTLMTGSAAYADQVSGEVCMGTIFLEETGKTLNCTANDITISEATGVSPASCTEGDTIELTAAFRTVLSGGGSNQTRYDIGIYFDTEGDPDNDGARGGICSLSVIQDDSGPLEPPPDYYVQLDPPPDICGDITAATSPLFPVITVPNVLCTDTDGDGFLNLPYCTSWRQPGSNEVCDEATDAFPGTPSKCNCDDTFNVPVVVAPPSAVVMKQATKAIVTYEVEVENNGTRTVSLDKICDDQYGALRGGPCPPPTSTNIVSNNTCDDAPDVILVAGATSTCSFDVLVPAPGFSAPKTNIATATLIDVLNQSTIERSDSATVTIDLPQ